MALCSLNKSLLRSNVCGYQLNSIVAIYLANFSDVVLSGTTVEDCDGTGATTNGQVVASVELESGKKWAKIEPARNTGAYSDVVLRGVLLPALRADPYSGCALFQWPAEVCPALRQLLP